MERERSQGTNDATPDLRTRLQAARAAVEAGDGATARPALEALCGAAATAGAARLEAEAWRLLATVERGERHPERAAAALEHACKRLRECGDRAAEADALLDLGDCQRARLRIVAAMEAYRAAAQLGGDAPLPRAHAAFKLGELLAQYAPEQADAALATAADLYEATDRLTAGDTLRLSNPHLPDHIGDCRAVEPWIMAHVARRARARLTETTEAAAPTAVEAEVIASPPQRRRDLYLAAVILAAAAVGLTAVVLVARHGAVWSLPLRHLPVLAVALAAATGAWFAARAADIRSRAISRGLSAAIGAATYAASLVLFPVAPPSAPPSARVATASGMAPAADDAAPLTAAAAGEPGDEIRAGFEHALAEQRARGDALGEAETLRAYAAFEAGIPAADRAIALYERSLAGFRAAGAARPAAEVAASLGDLFAARHHLAAARQSFATANALAAQLDDAALRLRLLHRLAAAERALGNDEAARGAYLEALQLTQRSGDDEGQVVTLLRLGDIERDAHAPDRARLLYAQAATFCTLRGDGNGQIRALLASAELDTRLGAVAAARAAFQEAARLARAARAGGLEVRAWRMRGDLERRAGQLDAARDAYAMALRISRERTLPAAELRNLVRLGELEAVQGFADAARSRFDEAIAFAARIDDQRGRAAALLALGNLDVQQARPEPARAAFEQALASARSGADTRRQIAALEHLGRLAAPGDASAAAAFAARADALRLGAADPAARVQPSHSIGAPGAKPVGAA